MHTTQGFMNFIFSNVQMIIQLDLHLSPFGKRMNRRSWTDVTNSAFHIQEELLKNNPTKSINLNFN